MHLRNRMLIIIVVAIVALQFPPLVSKVYAQTLNLSGIPDTISVSSIPQFFYLEVKDAAGNEPDRIHVDVTGGGISNVLDKTIYSGWNLLSLNPGQGGTISLKVSAWDKSGTPLGTLTKNIDVIGYQAWASTREITVGTPSEVRVAITDTRGMNINGLQVVLSGPTYSGTVTKTEDDGTYLFKDVFADRPGNFDLLVKDRSGAYKANLPDYIRAVTPDTCLINSAPQSLVLGKQEDLTIRPFTLKGDAISYLSRATVTVNKQAASLVDLDHDSFADAFTYRVGPLSTSDALRVEYSDGLSGYYATKTVPVDYPVVTVTGQVISGYKSPVTITLKDPRDQVSLPFELIDVLDHGMSVLAPETQAENGKNEASVSLLLPTPLPSETDRKLTLKAKLDYPVDIPVEVTMTPVVLTLEQTTTTSDGAQFIATLKAGQTPLTNRHLFADVNGSVSDLGSTDERGTLRADIDVPESTTRIVIYTKDDAGTKVETTLDPKRWEVLNVNLTATANADGATAHVSIRATGPVLFNKVVLNGSTLAITKATSVSWQGDVPLTGSETTYQVVAEDLDGNTVTDTKVVAIPKSPRASLTLGSTSATVKGKNVATDHAPFIDRAGTVYVPLYFLADALGYTTTSQGDQVLYLTDPFGRLTIDLSEGFVWRDGRLAYPIVKVIRMDNILMAPLVSFTHLAGGDVNQEGPMYSIQK